MIFYKTLSKAQTKQAKYSPICMLSLNKIKQRLKEEMHFKDKFIN